MDKHKQLVRQIAEAMAISDMAPWAVSASHKGRKSCLRVLEELKEDNIEKARISVKFAANILIDYAYDGDRSFYESDHEGKENFDKILANSGLIPPPEKATDND